MLPESDAERFPVVPPPPSTEATGPRRLSPAVMVLWPLAQVGPLVLFIILGTMSPRLLVLFIVFSAVSSVVRWQRFRWSVDGSALVIQQGVLQRQRRVLPLDRVQSVDLVRSLRHRLLGVVEVRVEAIGGGSTEGRIDALSPAEAQRLRSRLLRRPTGDEPTASATATAAHEAPAPLVRMRPRDLLVAGLTGGRVGVAAALLGFATEILGDRLDEVLRRLPLLVGGLDGILLVAALVVVGAFTLSIGATIVAYWDFTLWREEDVLRVRRGLLEQRSDTIPLRRVQAIRVEENAVRRLLGLAAVKVDVAGRSGADAGRDTGILLPIGRRRDALALAGTISGRGGLFDEPLRPMPSRARNRRFVRALAATAALTFPAVAAFGWRGLVSLAVAPPLLGIAGAAYRSLGWWRDDEHVLARAGVFVRRTVAVPVHRIQSLALTSSPPQRWRDLRSLELQIARSPGIWGGPELVDLDAEQAARLLAGLAEVVDAPAAAAA